MKTNKEIERLIWQRLNALEDFILNSVDDPNNWVVQKNINEIDRLYWECFNY